VFELNNDAWDHASALKQAPHLSSLSFFQVIHQRFRAKKESIGLFALFANTSSGRSIQSCRGSGRVLIAAIDA
jgi:hypothetical protein